MNVVVVAAHGLGCHWLGPYGNAWVGTPAADALASESVVFDRQGHRLATASCDGTVGVWEARTGRQCRLLRGHRACVESELAAWEALGRIRRS